MKKTFAAFAIVLAALSSAASASGSIIESQGPDDESLRMVKASDARESRAARLRTATTSPDTLWVGYTPQAVSATNWWGGCGRRGSGRRCSRTRR